MQFFHPGMQYGTKQGVPDSCFKIPSEKPEYLINFSN